MNYIIAIGTNIKKEENLKLALRRLSERFTIVAASSVYESEPYGYQAQPNFYNMVVKIETDLLPEKVLDILQGIEAEAGRVRGGNRWGPRTLDLDIVLWSEGEVETPRVKIPHYDLKNRLFFILPILEIEGDIPVGGETLFHLARRLLPYQAIKKVEFELA